ncbi:hypothetical protein KDA_38510 [Dictyobacter alpinus]|uniref:Uncharacterized protein n=1 Tax=Dictyobacter alpinus TaxID=2014873 RepID=A0A402BAQ1_9CHLR|nr:hypothetical protein KDA_38510 [Dictyobacter alpinus]
MLKGQEGQARKFGTIACSYLKLGTETATIVPDHIDQYEHSYSCSSTDVAGVNISKTQLRKDFPK